MTRSQPEEVEGDPAVQDALVRTVKLEISKERIREQFEEESDNLRLMAARVDLKTCYSCVHAFELLW